MPNICDDCRKAKICPMRTGDISCTGFDPRPETNADRIRRMTDRELAGFISERIDCAVCKEQLIGQENYCRSNCEDVVFDWLQKEADEDEY